MDNYRVPIDSRKEIAMTINTTNPTTTTSSYDHETALLSFVTQMVRELPSDKVWSITEHAMATTSKLIPGFRVGKMADLVRLSFKAKSKADATTTNPSVPTTDSNESLKGGDDATRKEATMATTKSEASELIASFTKNSLGDKLPEEYFIITKIVEAIPVLSKAVHSAMDIALIRAIITGEYPQLLKLSQGETLANARELVRALSNKNDDEVGITDLIKVLEFGSYDCQIDKEGRIAAALLINNLYK